MASALIYAIRTVSGNQPVVDRIIEKNAQTFVLGVPVQIDAGTGAIKEWDGATLPGIAGFSKAAGANLTTTGTAQTLTFGVVPFQSSGVNIPRGAPFNDGKTPFEAAAPDTVFYGQINPTVQVLLATDVGKSYGLTKDTDGHWFVDKTKVGASAAVKIIELDQNDILRGVHFQVLSTAASLTT
jgi:hypothetical protein